MAVENKQDINNKVDLAVFKFEQLTKNLNGIASNQEKKVFTDVMQDGKALAQFKNEYGADLEKATFDIGGRSMKLRDIIKSFDTTNNTIDTGKGKVQVKNGTDLAIAIQLYVAVKGDLTDRNSNAVRYGADGIIGTNTKRNINSHKYIINEGDKLDSKVASTYQSERTRTDGFETVSSQYYWNGEAQTFGEALKGVEGQFDIDFIPYLGKYINMKKSPVTGLLNRRGGLANAVVFKGELVVQFGDVNSGNKLVSINMGDYKKYCSPQDKTIKIGLIGNTLASRIDKYFVNKEKVRERLMTKESIQNGINKFDCNSLAEPLNRFVESLKFNNLDNDDNVIIDITQKYLRYKDGRNYVSGSYKGQLKIENLM